MKENTYAITKTVRFGLRDIKIQEKNPSYQKVADSLKDNSSVDQKIDKYTRRILESSTPEDWLKRVEETREIIGVLPTIIKNLNQSFFDIRKLKKDEVTNTKIFFKESVIRRACGFGKACFKKGAGNISLKVIDKEIQSENIKKYDITTSGLEGFLDYLRRKTDEIERSYKELVQLLEFDNHEKSRLSEIHHKLRDIFQSCEIILNIYLRGLGFNGGQREEGESYRKLIDGVVSSIDQLFTEKGLPKCLELFHDPKHGYEVGKASLHYRTLNKRDIPSFDIKEIEKILGQEILPHGNFKNPLAPYSGEIVRIFQNKSNKEKIFQGSLVEKAKNIISSVQKSLPHELVQDQDVTLWNICNALNNKKQTYDQFLRANHEFAYLGWKQKLKFGLTVLVDIDVYKTGNLSTFAKQYENEVRTYISNFSKSKETYNKYKDFTQRIKDQINPKQNAKDRGNLLRSWMRSYTSVNKEISQVCGALSQLLKLLQESKNDNLVQYYAVIGKSRGKDLDTLLLIDKKQAHNLYNYLHSTTLQKGGDTIYLYDSLTEKSLQKLFDQIDSKTHPFKKLKFELAEKKKKGFDELKFRDLNISDLKYLIQESDFAKEEQWTEKFKKFYRKLQNYNDKDSLLKSLTKEVFVFEPKQCDFEDLLIKFPDLIIAELHMNTNQKKETSHQRYFRKGLHKMIKHIDVTVKINPELYLYYTPQRDEQEKLKKEKEKQGRVTREQLENTHRYWRDQVTVGIPMEIYPKKPNSQCQRVRVVALDRGEKNIVTLCHLEKGRTGEIKILPISYWIKEYDSWVEKNTYFLDGANYCIGRNSKGEQVIRYIGSKDWNIKRKKQEYISRFIRTIWSKDDRQRVQQVLGTFAMPEGSQVHTECIKEFFENITYTNNDKKSGLKGNQIFNIHGLKNIQKSILDDQDVLVNLHNIIVNFQVFDFQNVNEEYVMKRQEIELKRVHMRDIVAGNIAGIVHFMFEENTKEKYASYCALENLHNSRYQNFTSKDVHSGTKIVNEDFIEATHNKLYQTGTYGKVEQAIMNKLQVSNPNGTAYYNYLSERENATIPVRVIQMELKNKSKEKVSISEIYKDVEIGISQSLWYGHIGFVDAHYTSKRCPRCGIYGKDKVNRNSTTDQITCKNCGFTTETNQVESSGLSPVKLNEIYQVIRSGDENGALFIGYRALHTLPKE